MQGLGLTSTQRVIIKEDLNIEAHLKNYTTARLKISSRVSKQIRQLECPLISSQYSNVRTYGRIITQYFISRYIRRHLLT